MSFGFTGRRKNASEGLLKAVSMRSPMPSRGIPKGSGAVALSRTPEVPGKHCSDLCGGA